MAREDEQAKQAKSRATRVEFVRGLARWKHPPPAILCNPDYEAKVREIVAEAGVDIPVVADPETDSYMKAPNSPLLESTHPELAKRLREHPEEVRVARDEPQDERAQTAQAQTEVRIVLHRPEERRTVRVETGPEGTEVHLDG